MASTLQPGILPLDAHPSASPDTAAQLAALLTGAGIAPLVDTGWIRVTGSDRVRWLNGMVTNSIQELVSGQGCYNFVLNAQGRIQGDLTAFAEPDALLLKTDRSRVPALIALLDHFIIMDDVELDDVTATRLGIAIVGPQAVVHLERIGMPAHLLTPMHKLTETWRNTPIEILEEHSPLVPRFELWATPAISESLHAALLASGATPCTSDSLEQLRILEGTPRYGIDIRDSSTAHDLPQETSQTRALHFSKGCYLGQEIVERIRSRGNVHRTFTGFQLTGSLPPSGTILEAPSEGGQPKPVGELTSVAAIQPPTSAAPIQLALGYIRREALDRNLPLQYPGGTAIPVPLPYANL